MKYTKEHMVSIMEKVGVIPVFNHSDIEISKKVLDASYDAGIRVFEFTNRDTKALDVFSELKKYATKYEDLLLGIGTIFSKAQAQQFIDAKTDFIVSPALIPEVMDFCNEIDLLSIPGCATITEVYTAHQYGAKLIKAFPGNVLGSDFIKAVKSVLPQIKIMPTGGVQPTLENLKLWFDSGVSCVGMGSQLFDKNDIKKQNFSKLTGDIKQVIQHIQSIKNQSLWK
ncbi:bifunctional 4-hydroxy-2-oxoglutarate aldolase/2-dehydro-3-deoxy-phosphogluconate aldolase [uncultured Aquimarina sp.]|uniref:bifunctional 4-hydroxy-2-oxoglutarate aldolase/2-dehydro-3-deoxy-phosphogluconate aldolase n=1 Tax=uncultured Aquimarina sp. TaxID=575652 RepID=UPI00260530F7|nr:bifunctional 4-hydroxy-2-oxoglutarate aldolase/2-dehydro-3-deoxy-phosphogluconate aldolase [uncultured Aquimarina sp.]